MLGEEPMGEGRGAAMHKGNGWPVPELYGCTWVELNSRSVHGNWYRFKYDAAESGAGANYIAAPGTRAIILYSVHRN